MARSLGHLHNYDITFCTCTMSARVHNYELLMSECDEFPSLIGITVGWACLIHRKDRVLGRMIRWTEQSQELDSPIV